MVKAAEGFHICHECVSKAVQLGKETSMEDPEPEPKQALKTGQEESETDWPLPLPAWDLTSNQSIKYQLRTKKGGFMFNAFWSFSFLVLVIGLKPCHSEIQLL